MAATDSTSAPVPSGLSALFSLSQAAELVPPMPLSSGAPAHDGNTKPTAVTASSKDRTERRHRRLSSTDQVLRRPEVATSASLSGATGLLKLSSLSLTSSGLSAPTTNLHSHPRQQVQANTRRKASFSHHDPGAIATPVTATARNTGAVASSVPTQYMNCDIDIDVEDDFDDGASVAESVTSRPGGKASSTKGARKRGTIYQCESCSKVYRHPSCLIKHRWEHTTAWRESSKFLLSKHQQVQMLEAAAILSIGSSLPEDRSLWPSYCSGGALPPPSTSAGTLPSVSTLSIGKKSVDESVVSHPTSSSMPVRRNMGRSTSTGPRMYDYNLKSQVGGASAGSLTQIRPGLLGRPTAPAALGEDGPANDDSFTPLKPLPVGVPIQTRSSSDPDAVSDVYSRTGYREPVPAVAASVSSAGASGGAWSLPRSELRSVSVSGSGSAEDEDEFEGGGSYTEPRYPGYTGAKRGTGADAINVVDPETDISRAGYGFSRRARTVKKETDNMDVGEDEWGMEVDMDLDY